MRDEFTAVLRSVMDMTSQERLAAIRHEGVRRFITDAVTLCDPERVVVIDDSPEAIAWVRQQAIDRGEEIPLATEGHTVHFDGYFDQVRNREWTRYLVPAGQALDSRLNQLDRDTGIQEIEARQRHACRGRTLYVRCFCLGPADSAFSLPCLQLTDSAYVAHSEDLLYRRAFSMFTRLAPDAEVFMCRHCMGELDERKISRHHDQIRVYIDYTRNAVFGVNTQYAGNSVGLKELALRLALRRADRDGWLAEHMFIMRVGGPGERQTCFCGALPSACGKTSTAMTPGEQLIAEDLAYLRVIDGDIRAASVESGIFGSLTDVNDNDDPVLWDGLGKPGEVIFSNVLVKDGRPYWLGMNEPMPAAGINYCGEWRTGLRGPDGQLALPSHKNARYTMQTADLANAAPDWDRPEGLPVGGIIYGGRDSDTTAPVLEAYSWTHGVCTLGAMLESETTAATVGREGVRAWNPMANLDFLSIPIGRYFQNHLDFAKDIPRPRIFGTNYFLKQDGLYLNSKRDKAVWLKWMELRVHDEIGTVDGGYGRLPHYEDLRRLFREVQNRDYAEADYIDQFSVRIPELLAKLARMQEIFTALADTPAALWAELADQRERLLALRAAKGDYVSPLALAYS